MHPSLIHEIASIGTSLLSRGIESASRINKPGPDPKLFSAKLSEAQALPETRSIEEMRTDIIESSSISQFLEQNKGNSISLDLLADGSMKLLSSSGDFLTLDKQTEICILARKFHQACLSSGESLSQDRPSLVKLIA